MSFLLVLHSHLPYVRGAGRWPHGEEWVHEAILGTYLPLLVALHGLRDAGIGFRITIGLTPTLLEQLADAEIERRFLEYLDDQIARAERDVRDRTAGRRELADFYLRSYRSLRDAYLSRFGRDVVGGFADLARSGHIEILTSGATHGYLPLLDEPSIHAQLALGIAATRRLTRTEPTGIWLPECAYRPGLETFVAQHGIDHFFTDAPLLEGADALPPVRAFGDVASPARWSSGALADRVVSVPASPQADVSRAYLVGASGVAAIARDPDVSSQVWSATLGYPGDAAYREFHRKDDVTGLRYWRVTDPRSDLAAKHEYDVEVAAGRVREHAAHFASLVRSALASARRRSGDDALVTTSFDSELFGHWWFEGVDWLSLVLRDLADVSSTSAQHLAAHPPRQRAQLREGSWGKHSDHSTWLNLDTAWMWNDLAHMQRRCDEVTARAGGSRLRARALRQMVRELLLAESSDWPFLVTTGQAGEYAGERFRAHAQRFWRCAQLALDAVDADEGELRRYEVADVVFPGADASALRAPTRDQP